MCLWCACAAGQIRESHAGDPRGKAGAQHLCGRVWRSSAEGSQGAERSITAKISLHEQQSTYAPPRLRGQE